MFFSDLNNEIFNITLWRKTMTRQPLLDHNRSYTFGNYFDLGFTVDDLVWANSEKARNLPASKSLSPC